MHWEAVRHSHKITSEMQARDVLGRGAVRHPQGLKFPTTSGCATSTNIEMWEAAK